MEKGKGLRDDNWTLLQERLLVEFIMIRTEGYKHLLKEDEIWVKIIEDINPTRKCNLSQIKKNGNI